MKVSIRCWGVKCLVVFCVHIILSCEMANAATLVHDFYLPLPEQQIRNTMTKLQTTGIGTNVFTVFSVVITATGTQLYYDHWEDGYEVNLASPSQSTTQIWGDGLDSTGIPPGYAHDPTNFPSGTVLSLTNTVTVPRLPPYAALYDGRDRLAATKAIVVSRAAWANPPGTVLACAVEVPATLDYGTQFIAPVGEDVIPSYSMFEYAGLFVMAGDDGTTVTVDPDGSGPLAATNAVINRGVSFQYNGGIRKGATVTASKPVQVHLATGDIGANYESRWFRLYPVDQWYSSYVTPVGTSSSGNPCFVYLYNTNTTPLAITVSNILGATNFSIPATNTYQYVMPQNSGAQFSSPGGSVFYALSTVNAATNANQVYDWGFTLVPSDGLTTAGIVGWGPGSSDLAVNGSPVWVTAINNTTLYVDYQGRGGTNYDASYTVQKWASTRIFDASDKNQTGLRVFTRDGTLFTAAWGEDAASAVAGNPCIDAGTTVIPFPVPVMMKTSRVYTDTSPSNTVNIGDTLEYTITLDNRGLLPLGNTVILDELPLSLAYVSNSTTMYLNGITNAVPDHPVDTPFPLGAPEGYTIPLILRGGTSILKFQVNVISNGTIINSGFSGDLAVMASNSVYVPPPGVSNVLNILFTDTNGVLKASYTAGEGVYVTVTNDTSNTSTTTVQTIQVLVKDLTSGDYQTITLTETGVNTGIFRNIVPLPTSLTTGLSPQDGTLFVANGDALTVSFTDPVFGGTVTAAATILAALPTKVLYLSSTGGVSQVLNRIDPVAAHTRQPKTLRFS